MRTKQTASDDEKPASMALSRRRALQAAGLGLATAAVPAWRAAAAQSATPAAGGTIDRAAVEAALPKWVALAEDAVAAGGAPGLAVAVVYRDEVRLTAGYGVRSTGDDEAVDADTVFQIASLSKPVGSTVVSAIVGRGDASWNDPVIAHLPGFLLSDPWATRELMIGDYYAHRSGLAGDAGGDLERLDFERDVILERLRYLDLATSPRSAYAYSNIGMTVGGVAAAAAAGMTWEEASAALLYEPLGMTRTSSRYADFTAETNRAAMHVRIDGAWVPEFTFDPDAESPAGGASSTANDMARWLRLLLGAGTVDGAELIPAAALHEAYRPRMYTGPDRISGSPGFYGYGWGIEYRHDGRRMLRHAGAFSYGAQTFVAFLPDDGLGAVVLSNAFPTGVADGLVPSLFDLVLHGDLTRDWIGEWTASYELLLSVLGAGGAPYVAAPADPPPALPADAYVGVYENDYAGPVEIGETDGTLTLRMGAGPREFALTHFDRDTFTYAVDLEPPAPLTGATFVIGPDGRAATLQLDYFAGNGQGTLRRTGA